MPPTTVSLLVQLDNTVIYKTTPVKIVLTTVLPVSKMLLITLLLVPLVTIHYTYTLMIVSLLVHPDIIIP